MARTPRSFSIDEDLDELLSERDDINASAVVNSFLREFVAGGRGKEAALEARLTQLDEEISDLEKQLQQKERERDRIERQLEHKRDDLYESVAEFVTLVENDEFNGDLSPDNAAVMKYANDAGVPAERFVEEVEAEL